MKIDVHIAQDELFISGALTYETVMKALFLSHSLLPSDGKLKVNLRDVTRCDSSSLAFLTALMRMSREKRTQLTFIQVPSQMLQISSVSGLDDVLPIYPKQMV